MKYVPDWWEYVLLVLSTYSLFHLLAEDTILDGPRRKLLRIADTWERDAVPGSEADYEGDDYRLEWGLFLTCPWCAGFWIGVVVYAAWLIFGDWTLVALTPFAFRPLVAAQHRFFTE